MHRLGGKGRGYGDDLKKAVDVTVKAGVEAAVNASAVVRRMPGIRNRDGRQEEICRGPDPAVREEESQVRDIFAIFFHNL